MFTCHSYFAAGTNILIKEFNFMSHIHPKASAENACTFRATKIKRSKYSNSQRGDDVAVTRAYSWRHNSSRS
jgi:hypothetical protein